MLDALKPYVLIHYGGHTYAEILNSSRHLKIGVRQVSVQTLATYLLFSEDNVLISNRIPKTRVHVTLLILIILNTH